MRRLFGIQGATYVLTGLWPTIDISSFIAVTGPKTDIWLVQAFGQLIAAQGAVFVALAVREQVSASAAAFAFASAAILVFIDCAFVSARTISGVYLVDAVGETVIALLWLVLWRVRRARETRE